jgi:hypothetical protein
MDWDTQTAYIVKSLPLKNEWDAAVALVRRTTPPATGANEE